MICSNMKFYATLASYVAWKEIIASCLELAIIPATGLHPDLPVQWEVF